MSDRGTLRAQALERDGGCVWPGDDHEGRLEMAHVRGVGMGGRPSADTLGNVAILCTLHHGLLDGRNHHGLRVQLAGLLTAYRTLTRP